MRSMRGWIIVSIGALTTLAGSAAFAGRVYTSEVRVDPFTRFASGSLAGARYSSNGTEFISCGTQTDNTYVGGPFRYGLCEARSAAGQYNSCYTDDPDFVDAIEAMTAFSYIVFGAKLDGRCLYVAFTNSSAYLPSGLGYSYPY